MKQSIDLSTESAFENTRPYNDSQVPAAVARIARNGIFPQIVRYLFPETDTEEYIRRFSEIKTVQQFQKQAMCPAIRSVVRQTASGLTVCGLEKLDRNKNYIFISNHRDILLDAAILQVLLLEHGFDTSEITFGSNLMEHQMAVDMGKINKMFRIVRGGNIHDFYRNSLEVSSYMRYAVTQKRQSVWIAQRNGRTKNGDDKTDMGVLKLFSLSSSLPFVDNLLPLNLVPIAVSYQYEPCDFLKTAELYVSGFQRYEKAPNEDLTSILHGVMQTKGHIHFSITDPITVEELEECDQYANNDKFRHLAKRVDSRIYANVQLFSTHYMAYDLLYSCSRFKSRYCPQQRQEFIRYMDEGLAEIDGEYAELRDIFLNIYAFPVVNALGELSKCGFRPQNTP
jgi:hypothetical protein